MAVTATIDMEMTDSEFRHISTLVQSQFGIQLPPEKRTLIKTRLQRMVRKAGYTVFHDFFRDHLAHPTKKTVGEIVDKISTNHTFFWRENAHFQWFRDDILPAIITRKRAEQSRDLRVWCAAASSGEEPYTLLMMMREALGPDYRQWTAGVLGTDICQAALDTAKYGQYPADGVELMPNRLRQRYFTSQANGQFRVNDDLRADVVYRRFNLLNASYPFKRPFDAVFIRNVMIYFDDDTKRGILRRIHSHLVPGGMVFIGMAESLQSLDVPFDLVKSGMYRRR